MIAAAERVTSKSQIESQDRTVVVAPHWQERAGARRSELTGASRAGHIVVEAVARLASIRFGHFALRLL
jgi:hypothetical protein